MNTRSVKSIHLCAILMILISAGCSPSPISTPPAPDMAGGVFEHVAYEYFHWREGLNVMIWYDVAQSSSCDSSGSTNEKTHVVRCQAISETGRAADGAWTQHTALTLCLAESLLERGGFDARDQVERYVKWHKNGRLSADGRPGDATPDVAKALATYQWRHQPMAGSHDPRDRSTASLPRVLAAAAFAMSDPVAAVRLAGEVSRTTHQSPYVLDACRYLGALLVGALRGARRDELPAGLYEPAPGLLAARPLKKTVSAAIRKPMASAPDALAGRPRAEDAVQAVVRARDAFGCAPGFEEAVQAACRNAADPALEAAIAGALYGAVFGAASLPRSESSRLKRADLLDEMASRLARAATTKSWSAFTFLTQLSEAALETRAASGPTPSMLPERATMCGSVEAASSAAHNMARGRCRGFRRELIG